MTNLLEEYITSIKAKPTEAVIINALKEIEDYNSDKISDNQEFIANSFYSILEIIHSNMDDNFKEKIKYNIIKAFSNIKQIANSNSNSTKSEIIIIKFLNELFQKRDLTLPGNIPIDDLLEEYGLNKINILLRDLQKIEFIFKFYDENEMRYFPINILLNSIIQDKNFINQTITEFHIKILQLAVETYNPINESYDVKEQLKKLNETYNLKFINYIRCSAKLIDSITMENLNNNHVMIFYDKSSSKVLIRSDRKEYFDDLSQTYDIEEEKNNSNKPIGYFVEIETKGKTAVSFYDVLKKAPIEMLRLLYEKNYKNIFLDNMILEDTSGYLPINPFCVNDKVISKKSIRGDNYFKKILEEIGIGRLTMLNPNSDNGVLDCVSFGLCAYLLEENFVEIDKFFSENNSKEWLQNRVFENWVRNTTIDNSIEQIKYILGKYLNDLEGFRTDLEKFKKYLEEDKTDLDKSKYDFKNLNFDKHICDTMPFKFNFDFVCQLLEIDNIDCIYVGNQFNDDCEKTFISLNKTSNIQQITDIDDSQKIPIEKISFINTDDIDNLSAESKEVYFTFSKNKLCYRYDYQNLYKQLYAIKRINQSMMDYKMSEIVTDNTFKNLTDILEIHKDELLDIADNRNKKINFNSLIRIKVINNLLLNSVDEKKKWEAYIQMFNEHEILRFSDVSEYDKFSQQENNVLTVPKEAREQGAVLSNIYNKYICRASERDTNWWYSPGRIEQKEDEFYYLNDNKIEIIRFLFDNTMSGAATKITLAGYLGKEKEWLETQNNRKSSLKLENKFKKIIDKCITYSNKLTIEQICLKNSPKIEVCSYYGTKCGQKKVQKFLQTQCKLENCTVEFHIEISKKGSMLENAAKTLGMNLKADEKNSYIAIREFNMPKKYCLPIGAVGNANNMVTLLVKKDEF